MNPRTRADREQTHAVVITRSFAAPREVVFQAWTDPAVLARWWWPARFATTYDVDPRVGGAFRFTTASLPDQGVLSVGGVFLEVVAPERLVYTWSWAGAEEAETRVTVEFTARGSATEIVLRHERFATEEVRADHRQGWNDCLDRLERLLAGNAS